MKTKIIPFDLETAKKIQAGEIKGKIKDQNGIEGTILTFECLNSQLPIIVRFHFSNGDNIFFVGNDGRGSRMRLSFEVPDDEPQFKPFDKVLVRNYDDCGWIPAIYQGEHNIEFNPFKYFASGVWYKYCIPYEGNEHLVYTTGKPKEE